MKSECEKLTQSLIDLVYGELPESEAEHFRAHAAECPKCREHLESILLTRKLVAKAPEPPPLTIDEAALFQQASEEANILFEKSRTTDFNTTKDQKIEQRPSFTMRLRRFLLTPALATTAAAVIVFAVSYFILEQGNPTFSSDENELIVPIAADSRGPMLSPSSNRKDSSRLQNPSSQFSHESSPAAMARKEPASPPGPSVLRRNPAKPNRTLPRSGKANGAAVGRLGTAAGTSQERFSYQERNGPSEKSTKNASVVKRKSASRIHPSQNNLGEIELDGEAEAPSKREKLDSAISKKPPSPSAKDLKEADTLYEKGLSAYLRGDCKTAISAFSELQRTRGISAPKRMIALHHLGRCEKRRGSCGKALVWYDQLLSSYRSYPQRSAALWESASCHRKLGHIDRTRHLLIELSKDAAWESRALGELEKIGGYSKLD